jgi:tRNA A-37 threonylcarbamoyl transferase component Bud32
MAGLEALLKGRELAHRYRIEEVIGRGGMGAVYRATDARLGRPVAVKVITVSAGNDPDVRERLRARFRHEAASAASLPHHPNVVPVYDYGTDEELGLDFIVMELLRGEDLASRLQRAGPPPLGEALRILQHAARGVAVGHRSGLIHRDVKPGNVFLVRHGAEEEVRVLDFGIAKAMAEEDTQSALTQDGASPLSPGFASPEQLRAEARLTPASDVFSLGAIGFQLFAGTRPFTEADRNRMAAGMEVPAPSLRSRNPQLPEDVERVIRRALSFDPAERYPHAGALADALEAPLRRLGETPAAAVPAALPVGPAGVAEEDDRTVLAGADDDDRTRLAPVPPPPARGGRGAAAQGAGVPPSPLRVVEERRGLPAVVWVLLLLAVAGAAAFLAWQQLGPRGGPSADFPGDTLGADTLGADTADVLDAAMLSLEGRRFFAAGQYDSALAYFNRAIALEPASARYREQAAGALIGMGRYEEAASLVTGAIRDLNGNDDLLWSRLAEARLAQGDTVSAIAALERFVELSLDPAERRQAVRRLQELRSPPPEIQPVPRPLDTEPWVPGPSGDTFGPGRAAPRDSIRIGPP